MQTATNLSSPQADPKANGSKPWFAYLLLVFVLPALLASTAFFVVTRPSYESWGPSKWGPELEYPFVMPPQNADVVIFGDSSAFLGIDPRLIDARLGTRSVVLPATIGSLPVIGDRTLALYLQRNRRPKLLVLYFAPWNLDYQRTAKIGLFEGEELLLRHTDRHDLLHYARRYPVELLKFPFRFYNTFTLTQIAAMLHRHPVDRGQAIASARGHMAYSEPIPALESPCTIPKDYLADTASGSVQELAERYRAAGLQVMVYLAPIPHCTNTADVPTRSFAALGALGPGVLPAGDFAADPYYAHIRPEAVPASSLLLAQALGPRLQRSTAP